MILNGAASRPDAVAVDGLTRRRTWRELDDRSARVAHLLRDGFHLRPGGHVAVLMHNRVEFIELVWGAILGGLRVTPLNLQLREAEIAYSIRDSGARILFADPEHEAGARRS